MARTIQDSRANLESSLGTLPARYTQGLRNADWATNAGSDAAEQLWAANVQAAAAQKRRQRAIQAVGNEVWRTASMNKGAANIAAGVRAGLDKYVQKFGPILQAMTAAAASLPPRTSDPIANIQNRLVPVVKAARAAAGKA